MASCGSAHCLRAQHSQGFAGMYCPRHIPRIIRLPIPNSLSGIAKAVSAAQKQAMATGIPVVTGKRGGLKMARVRSAWETDNIQFPRLLAEIRAIGLSDEQMRLLEDAMDLESGHIEELLERAENRWEKIKTADLLRRSSP